MPQQSATPLRQLGRKDSLGSTSAPGFPSSASAGQQQRRSSFSETVKKKSDKNEYYQFKERLDMAGGGGKRKKTYTPTRTLSDKELKKKRKSANWGENPEKHPKYVEMEQRTEKYLAKLTPEQKQRLSNSITTQRLQENLLPFDEHAPPELNHAFMTGRLLSKEMEDRMVIKEDKETGEIDIFDKKDPYWLKATLSLLTPFESTSVDDPRKRVLASLPTDHETFFATRTRDAATVGLLLNAQGFQGKLSLMRQTFDRMRTEWNLQPETGTFNIMLAQYASRGDYIAAYNLFKLMTEQYSQLKPDQATFGCIIQALVEARKIDQAFDIMESMRAYDLVPNVIIHTMLLAGCVATGDLPRAWSHFELMISRYEPPNEITYSIMINAAAVEFRAEKAFSLLSDMEQLNLHPTEVTFNTVIKACARVPAMHEKAFEVAQRMQTAGFKPDIYTFATLINICGKMGNVEKAYQLLEQMRNRGVNPNTVVYNTVLDVLARNSAVNYTRHAQNKEGAIMLFDQMVEQGVEIDVVTLNSVLKVLTFSNQHQDAIEFFKTEYDEFGIQRDSWTYCLMIRLAAQFRRINDMEEYIGLMEQAHEKDSSVKLTYYSYQAAAIAYAKRGEHKKAFEWLQNMHSKYGFMLKPNHLRQFKDTINATRQKAYELEHLRKGTWIDQIDGPEVALGFGTATGASSSKEISNEM